MERTRRNRIGLEESWSGRREELQKGEDQRRRAARIHKTLSMDSSSPSEETTPLQDGWTIYHSESVVGQFSEAKKLTDLSSGSSFKELASCWTGGRRISDRVVMGRP